MQLNIHEIIEKSQVNGPGTRTVIWLQGCSLKCPGCFNPHTHSLQPKQLYSVKELADYILSLSGIEGVTNSGGEPFEQAQPLAKLSAILQEHGLSVMSYSGFTLAELTTSYDPAQLELLWFLDILVDGRYDYKKQQPNLLWRGSTNQQIHLLSSRYQQHPQLQDSPQKQRVEMHFDPDGGLKITGMPVGKLKLGKIFPRF